VAIERPIFLVGMPRSGTTLVFEIFTNHPDLGWLSFRFNRLPRWPILSLTSRLTALGPAFRKSVGRTDQKRHPILERLREGPSEAYRFWRHHCGEKFLYDYLLGVRASESERRGVRRAIAKVLRYQGKKRFAAKLTGPSRIGYLESLFEDALFVHIVRDGRAVVNSLLNVDFWRDTFRRTQPAWKGGLSEADLEKWRSIYKSSPAALAALQWRRVMETTREESAHLGAERYLELRYEDFLAAPRETLAQLTAFAGLEPAQEIDDYLETRVRLKNMNYQFRERFSPEELAMLEEVMGEELESRGYGLNS